MADIFLSYAQKDGARAKQVAHALTASGWSVWWDVNLIAGARFRPEIAKQLQSAKCVVVLWSRASIESDWVVDEAEDGRRRGVLAQALLDDTEPPHGFRSIHYAKLTDWAGDIHAQEFVKLRSGVIRITGGSGKRKHASTRQQIRYWIQRFPKISEGDAETLFNNAIASWRAVVAAPIMKASHAGDATVIVHTESGRGTAVAEKGPPTSKRDALGIWFSPDQKWTARTFEAASCRMLGHVLGLDLTDTPGQLMSEDSELKSLPLTPQEEDIRRARALWPD